MGGSKQENLEIALCRMLKNDMSALIDLSFYHNFLVRL